MIPVVIFTFGPDGPAALLAARSAARAGLGPVFVEVDGVNPVSPEIVRDMEADGFNVSYTDFPHTVPLAWSGLLQGNAEIVFQDLRNYRGISRFQVGLRHFGAGLQQDSSGRAGQRVSRSFIKPGL